jgi:hypothetical protein
MPKLQMTDIVIDESLYPRSQLNGYGVQRMVDAFRAGAVFPPLVVEAKTNRLIDGRTRYETYLRCAVTEVDCRQKSYPTEADVYADAVRLNTTHGQPLTNYDVRSAVARLEQLHYPHEQIAEVVKVPVERIAELIKGFAHDQAGDLLALKGGLAHLRGETLTAKQVTAQRHYGGAKGVFYVRQVILMIENNLCPKDGPFASELERLVTLWTHRAEAAE